MHLFTAISTTPPPLTSFPTSVMWDGRCVGTDSPASTPMNAVDERERGPPGCQDCILHLLPCSSHEAKSVHFTFNGDSLSVNLVKVTIITWAARRGLWLVASPPHCHCVVLDTTATVLTTEAAVSPTWNIKQIVNINMFLSSALTLLIHSSWEECCLVLCAKI